MLCLLNSRNLSKQRSANCLALSAVVLIWCSYVEAWGKWNFLGCNGRYYQEHEAVPLYANIVGPIHNPSETYQYYDLPFCKPLQLDHKLQGLGEILAGDRLVTTLYDLSFRVDKENEKLCTTTLSREDVRKFRQAIKEDYYFQMFYDDLRLWAFIGLAHDEAGVDQRRETRFLLFTHVHFEVEYNGDRVIGITPMTDPLRTEDVTEDGPVEVTFSFSTTWMETNTPFERRLEKYSKYSSSIVNSLVIVLLTGLLVTILAGVLKHDNIKYVREDDAGGEGERAETGWKSIRGDVFRPPPWAPLSCAVVGAGTQLLVLALLLSGLALFGWMEKRGAVYTAAVLLYALTAGVSGYVSSSLYRNMGGSSWASNVTLTACLFCGPFLLVFALNDTVAVLYGSTRALPFGTMTTVALIWVFLAIPLTADNWGCSWAEINCRVRRGVRYEEGPPWDPCSPLVPPSRATAVHCGLPPIQRCLR